MNAKFRTSLGLTGRARFFSRWALDDSSRRSVPVMRLRSITIRSFVLGALAFATALTCVGGGEQRASALSWSDNLDIAASVNITCTIIAAPVAFGTYSPGGAHATAPLDGTGGISVNCSSGGGNTRVSLGQGLYPQPGSTNNNPLRQMGNGALRLRYNLYSDAAHTTVWNNNNGAKTGKNFPVLMTVFGRIPAAQFVQQGTYTDSIVATVTF
jgi:spore coat protein U-like protein